ncbi:hypothetical protein ALC62_02424 [Cyphomyrmex costatus]|uniref:Uncharacterized protein n=1 Tax=Cyphomyrmex costatus TaxID=456900 RepID=A0A151IN25_9HYME|nr:hypothetical protein ALC62_02424 [Cyphomyrmex costatus]
MYVNGSELASLLGHEIQLRPLVDRTDRFEYPLYASSVQSSEMAVVRHIWRVANTLRNNRRGNRGDLGTESVKFIATLYASMAFYPNYNYREDERRRQSWDRGVVDLYDRFDEVFGVEYFLQWYSGSGCPNIDVYRTTVTTEEIAMRISTEPKTIFSRIAILSVARLDDMQARVTNFIREKVQVFPIQLINTHYKRNEWVVTIDSDDPSPTRDPATLKRLMKRIRLERRSRRISRRTTATSNVTEQSQTPPPPPQTPSSSILRTVDHTAVGDVLRMRVSPTPQLTGERRPARKRGRPFLKKRGPKITTTRATRIRNISQPSVLLQRCDRVAPRAASISDAETNVRLPSVVLRRCDDTIISDSDSLQRSSRETNFVAKRRETTTTTTIGDIRRPSIILERCDRVAPRTAPIGDAETNVRLPSVVLRRCDDTIISVSDESSSDTSPVAVARRRKTRITDTPESAPRIKRLQHSFNIRETIVRCTPLHVSTPRRARVRDVQNLRLARRRLFQETRANLEQASRLFTPLRLPPALYTRARTRLEETARTRHM